MSRQLYKREYPWGSVVYFKDSGQSIIHRLDGPAIIYFDHAERYFINNIEYSKEKFIILAKKFEEEDIEDAIDLLSI